MNSLIVSIMNTINYLYICFTTLVHSASFYFIAQPRGLPELRNLT